MLVPAATIIAALVNPSNPRAATYLSGIQAAARTLGRKLQILQATNEREIDDAFVTLVQSKVGALLIVADILFNSRSTQLAALSVRHAVPTIYEFREFAEAGGLMSYGSSVADAYRQAGAYTGRVLDGEKPRDLPVQQATRLQLIINLKTAKALGLDIPPTLLARADEVIE
jgi:putative ABC transport system substrate-binding protein